MAANSILIKDKNGCASRVGRTVMDERFARAHDAITWDMWNALPKEVKVYISELDRQWERNWIALQDLRARYGVEDGCG